MSSEKLGNGVSHTSLALWAPRALGEVGRGDPARQDTAGDLGRE